MKRRDQEDRYRSGNREQIQIDIIHSGSVPFSFGTAHR
jgi:hypothetical protein